MLSHSFEAIGEAQTGQVVDIIGGRGGGSEDPGHAITRAAITPSQEARRPPPLVARLAPAADAGRAKGVPRG